jgi:hypothetical protein
MRKSQKQKIEDYMKLKAQKKEPEGYEEDNYTSEDYHPRHPDNN